MSSISQHRTPVSQWKLWSILSWGLILAVAISIPLLHQYKKQQSKPVGGEASVDLPFQISGQYTFTAARGMERCNGTSGEMLKQLKAMATTPAQHLAASIVEAVVNDEELTIAPVETDADFARAYPWFVKLANPVTRPAAIEQARRVFTVMLVAIIAGLGVLALGVAMGILAIILLATKKIHFTVRSPQAPAGRYVEAFAVWLALFVLGSIVIEAVVPQATLVVRMLPLGIAFVVGLSWSLMRGTPWGQYREDVGLNAGNGVLREILAGVGGYLACLPLMGLALVATIVLSRYAQQTTSHPLVDQINDLHPIYLYLVAAVFAPVTEEILFRGLLLSHLRARFGILLSALFNSVIFAAIHPQGWLAIPALTVIAFNLSLIRQWRGSLIGPIIAHGLHNGILVTFALLIMKN